MSILPPSKPRITTVELHARLPVIDRIKWPVIVVGIRGYYQDSMGKVDQNDRGMYDDCLAIDSPSVTSAFNGNTDPGAVRKGKGFGAGKGMASLKAGVYYAHRVGIHKAGKPGAHQALIQVQGPVTVVRDGDPSYEESGYFGINIHRGGITRTNSEGCQTVPPSQWDAFIATLKDQLSRYSQTTVPYILLEN
jgi:hypothetical protein